MLGKAAFYAAAVAAAIAGIAGAAEFGHPVFLIRHPDSCVDFIFAAVKSRMPAGVTGFKFSLFFAHSCQIACAFHRYTKSQQSKLPLIKSININNDNSAATPQRL